MNEAALDRSATAKAADAKDLGRAAGGKEIGRAAGGKEIGRAAGGKEIGRAAGGKEIERRKVLVVDDEPTIADAVATRLRSEGFDVETAADGPSAVAAHDSFLPDIVVLDIMLPGFDGHEVCRRIQRERRVPVIMLTARTDETDVLVGLGVGADDYMTKPFSPRELVARVHAVLRRVDDLANQLAARDAQVSPATTVKTEAFTFGDVVLDADSRVVTRGEVEVHLTVTEFDIALWMLRHPRSVFTRGQLLQSVWGYLDTSGERTVDSHIQALRRKLGSAFVRTVHGVGYSLGSGALPAHLPSGALPAHLPSDAGGTS